MKKVYILVTVICLMAGAVNAQKYYARLGVGVGLGLSSYDGQFGDVTITNTSDVTELKSGSLGRGLNVNLGLGYMFSKYVGLDLGFNEFIGFGVNTTYDENRTYFSQKYEDKLSCMMFQIIPALVITPGLEKINPYGRFGLIIGVVNNVKYSSDGTVTSVPELKAENTSSRTYKEKNSGGVAIGFSTALGADYNLNEKFCLYAEINLNGLTYSPTKGKATEWTIDGVDQLPDADTKDKEWEYVKKLDYDVDIPDDSPDQYLKVSALLTNVGISIGLKYRFGAAN